MENTEKDFTPIRLDDEQLEDISGGYAVGEVVKITPNIIEYCPGCGRLVNNLPATITGVRGILDNKTIYWVTQSCCGYRSSRVETCLH